MIFVICDVADAAMMAAECIIGRNSGAGAGDVVRRGLAADLGIDVFGTPLATSVARGEATFGASVGG